LGSDTQNKSIFPPLPGEKSWGVCTERDGPAVGIGPDAVIATAQSGGYVLNGRKSYVGNAGVAGLYVILGCTDKAVAQRVYRFHRPRNSLE